MLLYGLEACTLNKSQLNRFLIKMFQTNNIEIVRACQESFGFKPPSILFMKRTDKTGYEISCVKFMFITGNKKVNTVCIFITCTIMLRCN